MPNYLEIQCLGLLKILIMIFNNKLEHFIDIVHYYSNIFFF